jgi:dihydroneopterin aldolase
MDRILLQGIEFYAYHGVRDEERRLGQRFSVDVDLVLDLRPAGNADVLSASVDYATVCRAVEEIGTGEPVRLLEALAERIARTLLERFPAASTRVLVRKLAPPIPGRVGSVAVEITRP